MGASVGEMRDSVSGGVGWFRGRQNMKIPVRKIIID